MKNWYGLMKVLEFQHLDVNGEILYQEKNILNTLHVEGEEFILSVCFGGLSIPNNYYFGMDSRFTISPSDVMVDIYNGNYEPTGFGYLRQQIPSTGSFSLLLSNGNYKAVSPAIQFTAIGGSWGPVQNIFLTNESNYEGYLIGSASLQSPVTVNAGQSIAMRFSMGLKDGS